METARHLSGTLFLVVGPSGAGKDSLIDGARTRLNGDPGVIFPRRVITRPPGSIGEDHIAVDEAEFDRLRQEDAAFALHWDAHGLRYGIPAAIDHHLSAGRHVVINVSRGVIDQARARYPRIAVVSVTVPEPVLEDRLRTRGRESEEMIHHRLSRARSYRLSGNDVVEIDNGGVLDISVNQLVAMLRTA